MHEDQNDTFTVAALAVLAFILADAGHEVVGHGIGFYLAGGRSGIFTTTRLIETQRLGDRGGDVFDLGGPAGNLACAGAAWLLQHVLRIAAPRLRLLLWLVMAFGLFWAFGSLLFSGAFAKGDWLALVRRWPHLWIWRTTFIVAGFFLYRFSLRLAVAELSFIKLFEKQHPPSGFDSLPRQRLYCLRGCGVRSSRTIRNLELRDTQQLRRSDRVAGSTALFAQSHKPNLNSYSPLSQVAGGRCLGQFLLCLRARPRHSFHLLKTLRPLRVSE